MMRRRQQGFTLLELMVAISILAVTFAALMQEGAQVSRNTKLIKDKTIAHWVAMNKAAELGIDTHVNKTFPGVTTLSDSVEMGGTEWKVDTEISDTPNPFVRKAEILVSNASRGNPVTDLTVLLRNPAP